MKILVTGASGHLGSATIQTLLRTVPAFSIAAMTRRPADLAPLAAQGVDVRLGDYKDPASLRTAFTGIDTLFLVSSGDLGDRTTQHINAVDAAKESGVKHVVFTSFQRKRDSGSPVQFLAESYIATEQHLAASGLAYTFLRNGLYADGLPMFLGDQVLKNGVFFPAGDGAAAWTARQDMADASANVLTTSGHEGKTYEFATEENSSFAAIAALLSGISGSPVPYLRPTVDAFTAALKSAGVPEMMIGMSARFAEAIEQGEFTSGSTDLERLLGRKPVTMLEFLQRTYAR